MYHTRVQVTTGHLEDLGAESQEYIVKDSRESVQVLAWEIRVTANVEAQGPRKRS
jgi:hypothetical protein